MNRLIIPAIVLLIAISCQEDNFKEPNYNSKIVVDGWIEQGQPAKVLLTLSAPYFSEIDSVSIRNLLITRAKVSVSDGLEEEVLTLRKNSDYFPPYIYESTFIKGVVGRTYALKVEYSGKVITSSTQIPEPQKLDSMWFNLASDNDTSGNIVIRFTDKNGEDNYYRVLSRTGIKTEKYDPTFLPNIDGRLIDGQTVSLSVSRQKKGKAANYRLNDTVSIKLCTMNLEAFNFWRSLNQEQFNSQNPFASSVLHVESNIDGGIGIWAGYGISNYRIVCKKR